MNPKLQLISLTLTNIVNTDSDVNLLSSNVGLNNSPFDTYYELSIINRFLLSASSSISYTLSGTPITYNVNGGSAVPSMDALILDLNINLGSYALFTYELSSVPNYYNLIIKILDSNFIPVQFRIYRVLVNDIYTFNPPYETIAGSTVTVQTEGGITYNELLSELQNQPYMINPVNIYTNTQIQSLQRFRKTQREKNGVSLIEFERPKLDPMQNQFAIEGIETKFTPSSLNALNYRMKASETVRIWLYYQMIDISHPNEIPPINKVLPKTVEKMIIRQSINPFFDLVGITNVKRINIKEDIKKDVKLRENITDEEVYNSFDGLDYKNIKK
jgi:hypothetical protein